MAFPTIPTTGAGRILSTNNATATSPRTFPNQSSLTKNAGDLLVAIIVAYQTSTGTNAAFSSWGGSYTEFHDSATSTTMAIGAAYKWSTGSESGTFTVAQAGTITGHAVCTLISIPGAHASTPPEAGGRSSAVPADPSSFGPSWGAEDTLWIAVCGNGETATGGTWSGISAAPTNYGDLYTSAQTGDAVGTVQLALAFQQLNASSEDVGAFTQDTSNTRSGGITIAIRPAAAIPVRFNLPTKAYRSRSNFNNTSYY